MYPLANDETGTPLDVPAAATGWLVRRHGGGKGRPAAIYDADGRPLVVPLDATARELRAHGCLPGPHRLDAVDGDRRPLGVAAFTEILPDDDAAPESAVVGSSTDNAVAALARAVEAMQRVQAERERVQAEMFMRLIDRMAPPPVQPAQDLRNALGQVEDVQKALRKMSAAQTVANATTARDDAEDDETEAPVHPAVAIMEQTMPLLAQVLCAKLGIPFLPAQAGATGAANGAATQAPEPPSPSAAPEAAAAPVASAAPPAPETAAPAPAPGVPAIPANVNPAAVAKLQAVYARLTPAEQARLEAMVPTLPPQVRQAAEAQLQVLSTDQAVSYVRKLIGPNKQPTTAKR